MLEKNLDCQPSADDMAAFYDHRRMWIDLVLEHPDVTHAEARVGIWLARKMNARNKCCWWSVEKIAKQITGMSTKTVSKATTALEVKGLMRVVRTKGRGNTYYIRAPFI